MSESLKVENLSKTFNTSAGTLTILQQTNLKMNRGDAVAITGPSGSGKSTLLYIIGLLDEPTSGEVIIADEHPLKLDAAKQAGFRNENIGFIFQDHHLLPQCTVLENVTLPTLASSASSKSSKGDSSVEQRAKELLERVGLADRLNHRPGQLSGGERQRVAVCRALINRPLLLLADEPTGNLDPKTADSVGTLLLEIAREQQTMLICVTHSRELADRFTTLYELSAGQLVDASRITN